MFHLGEATRVAGGEAGRVDLNQSGPRAAQYADSTGLARHRAAKTGVIMALTGNVDDGGWTVRVKTVPADGGFCGDVCISGRGDDGEFSHAFRASGRFATEREALLEGLREGMAWIGLKRARTIRV